MKENDELWGKGDCHDHGSHQRLTMAATTVHGRHHSQAAVVATQLRLLFPKHSILGLALDRAFCLGFAVLGQLGLIF